jgi:putative methionine-R-sulfoxide reductase with GAF domain
MIEGQDPLALAQRAVDLVARATDSGGVFVYLWDEQEQVLVLSVGTAGVQSQQVGRVTLRLGEGVTGWAALKKQSVVLNRDIQNDPRFMTIPELQEEDFNSMLVVPIVAPQGTLLGVFSLWSYQEDTFTWESKLIAEEVGRLLASGLLQAEMVEDLRRQSAAAHFLVQFPINSATSVLQCAQAAAQSILKHMNSRGCVIEYFGRGPATSPPTAVAMDMGGERSSLVRTTHSRSATAEFIESNFAGHERISVSFGLTSTRGIVTCYRQRRYSTRELDRLSAICSQLAALFEAVELESVGSSHASRLLRSVGTSTFARILGESGWTQGRTLPVLVRVKRLKFDSDAVSRRITPYLQELAGTRSLVFTEGALSLLFIDLPAGGSADIHARLEKTLVELDEQRGVSALAGIGPIAPDAISLQSALSDAETALAWTELTAPASRRRVTAFGQIEHLRDLPLVGEGMSADIKDVLTELQLLMQHDTENGTQLAETVAMLLSNKGSIADTVSKLHIHRNTLRQRLQRVEQLIGHSFEESGDWLPTGIAARLAMRQAHMNGT